MKATTLLKKSFRHFSRLIVTPRISVHPSAGQLEARRLLALQDVITIALEISEQEAKAAAHNAAAVTAITEIPTAIDRLTAERVLVDQLHSLKRCGQNWSAAA